MSLQRPQLSAAAPPRLSLRRLWWTVGWMMVAFVLVSTLEPPRYVPNLHLWDKLEHALAFFGLTLWFSGLVRLRRFAWLSLWMLVLGGGIEIAQGTMGWGRDMDIHDFYADAIGVAIALALALGGLHSWPRMVERTLGFSGERS